MKRLTALLLAMMMLLSLGTGAAAAEPEEKAIYSRQELAAIAEDPAGHYRLEADIDMGGEDWIPIPFYGTLDGQGHTIYNLRIRQPGTDRAVSVDGNHKEYDTVYAGLFSVTKDAEIRDLVLLGADVKIETDQHCFAAMLAGCLENTTISGCTVMGRVEMTGTNIMVGVGGVAGFGKGTIKDCYVEAELTYFDHSSGIRCEQFLGGLLGTGNTALQNNEVVIAGFDSCHGYVHNGGLVGMHYRYDDTPAAPVVNNNVKGKITFFEQNPDRRAYCAPFVGELLTFPSAYTDNSQDFIRDERWDYKTELKPNPCENPVYADTVTPSTCTDWGYTTHACSTCGYEYRSEYTAPAHTPGEWVTLQEPTLDAPGSQQLNCSICGAALELREIPQIVAATACVLSDENLVIHYKDTAKLTAEVMPDTVPDRSVTWRSSNEAVASVDQNGVVTALERGETDIVCTSADGRAAGSCHVTVDYTPGQWAVKILLFGWLWY